MTGRQKGKRDNRERVWATRSGYNICSDIQLQLPHTTHLDKYVFVETNYTDWFKDVLDKCILSESNYKDKLDIYLIWI